jgi:hypothetical protein
VVALREPVAGATVLPLGGVTANEYFPTATVNVIEVPVELWGVPLFRATDQEAPLGAPVSTKVIVTVGALTLSVVVTFAPETVTEPAAGVAE